MCSSARFEKDNTDPSGITPEGRGSSDDADMQSDESDFEQSDLSEGDGSTDDDDSDNNGTPDIIAEDDSVLIPPSGRVTVGNSANPDTDANVESDGVVLPMQGDQQDNARSEACREPSDLERSKQAAVSADRCHGVEAPLSPSRVVEGPNIVTTALPQPTTAHVPKPVVTIVRAQPDSNGFWESKRPSNPCLSTTAITMATQTDWDLWGSPMYSGERSLAPSKRAPECDCKHNVRLLNEWRREVDRKMEVDSDKSNTKFNLLKAKIIEGEEEREKMRATIASLTKQVTMNSATPAELKARAAGPSHGSVHLTTRDLVTANQADVVMRGGDPPLPQRSQGTAARPRNNNNTNRAPTMNVRNGNSRENPGSYGPSAGHASAYAQYNEPLGRNEPRPASRPQVTTNTQSTSINPGRTQNGGPASRRDAPPPNNTHTMRPEGVPSNSGTPGSAPSRSNQSVPTTNRESVISNIRPKSVQVVRVRNEPRANPEPSQHGELSFAWSEEPISDNENGVISKTPAPRSTTAAPMQKDSGPIFHQNRYDILRDAMADTMQREEAARKADEGGIERPAQPNHGEKRDNGDLDGLGDRESYLDVAGRYDWESENKRRRRSGSGDHVPPIYGVKYTPQRDIFVRDLALATCSSPEDLETRVKNHCRLRGVVISFVKAFPIKSNCSKANCKITVNLEDVSNVLSETFWPQYVSARPWRLNPPNSAANEGIDNRGLE